MKLNRVFARFYKSFNFDHLRKAHPEARSTAWEMYEDQWFPYVEIPIDPRITTVVGANESGKSHLLTAIEKAITGEGFRQRDLCRYSPFFNVERGKTCWPHLGLKWTDVNPDEASQIAEVVGRGAPDRFSEFMMFREGPDRLILYLPDRAKFSDYLLEGDDAHNLGLRILPRPFRIKSNIALPSSVPLAYLVKPTPETASLASRKERAHLLQAGSTLKKYWKKDLVEFTQLVPNIYSSMTSFFAEREGEGGLSAEHIEGLALARSLLLHLANLDPARLDDLAQAITDGEDGHANALMDRINAQLGRSLNFPKWWVQDRDFALQVTLREADLVFTIRDRTGTEYTFDERSSGLRYFLSYLIQFQVHEPPGRSEILLMDEPDAYLSAEAQQDLLKIFDSFADPSDGRPPVQVIYVTHSPFLLDKNHAERIRVLQKGKGFDGTRVIKNASQNHYEPLRSAFGAYVGETAFIGSCNLLVEGTADQIVLCGAARLTRSVSPGIENDTLDLNSLVIVPCGSASQVPYMLYLVRGRDAEKPPVIALLDSDDAGNEAAHLLRFDKRMRRLIGVDLVIQLGDLKLPDGQPSTIVDIEDLVPPELVVASANQCLREVGLFREEAVPELTIEQFQTTFQKTGKVFNSVNLALKPSQRHVEKIAFARALIEQCGQNHSDPALQNAVNIFLERMRVLFRRINVAKRRAEKEAANERISTTVDRHHALFVRDHPTGASREQAANVLEQVADLLDDSLEADAVKVEIAKLSRDFRLDDQVHEPVGDYEAFKLRLGALKDAFELQRHEQPIQPESLPAQRARARPSSRQSPRKVNADVSSKNKSKLPARKARGSKSAAPPKSASPGSVADESASDRIE